MPGEGSVATAGAGGAPDTPRATVTAWFAAWGQSNEAAARALVTDGVTLHATAPRQLAGAHVGWDAFIAFYAAKRRAEGPDFAWQVEELLDGERHAAALLRLSAGPRTWRQTAVYRVEDGRIAEIWFYEDEPP